MYPSPFDDYDGDAESEPTIDASEDEVAATRYRYPARPPGTFVVSGPLGPATGEFAVRPKDKRRRFECYYEAYDWAFEKYGKRLLRRMTELEGYDQWGFEVRGA